MILLLLVNVQIKTIDFFFIICKYKHANLGSLPGMVVQVVHVLLMFIHVGRHVVELHLQIHHLQKTHKRSKNEAHKNYEQNMMYSVSTSGTVYS